MSFEYNGVVYRDLEPQVRYDAEQVQLLKQADVTINENLQTVNESLQTVNTEVNGKLDKPTNPSAESAVTMLADGTVGTKPLSEIGGGGGKLYLHYIIGSVSTNSFNVCLYTSSSEPINSNDKAFNVLNVGQYQNRIIPGYFNADKRYCCGVIFDYTTGTPAVRVEYLSETGNNVINDASINNDLVTEI